jgi:nucleolar protein 56
MDIREKNIELTIKDIEKAITKDNIIIYTIHTIDEITKCINKLTVSLRERYGIYAPLTSRLREEDFLKKTENMKKEEMGIDLTKEDLNSISQVLEEIKNLQRLNEKQTKYIENLMKEICPKTMDIATPLITARLIDHAGSLKKLAELPSSTIQVLGAEKALFRHLKSKAKAPKFGIIFAHQNITNSENKGKAARQLSASISLAAKMDYFKDEH